MSGGWNKFPIPIATKVGYSISRRPNRGRSVPDGGYGENKVDTAGMFDSDRRSFSLLRRSANVRGGAAPAAGFVQRQADSAAGQCLQKT